MNAPVASNPASLSQAFKEAMSRVAGAVHLVTTSGPAGLGGATVTAMTSLTDTPPALLICLKDDSQTLERIRANGIFAVNVLGAPEQAVAEIFAGRGGFEGSARFRAEHGWQMEDGAPVLDAALASFRCRVAKLEAYGRSVMVIGDVVSATVAETDTAALLYHRRAFAGL